MTRALTGDELTQLRTNGRWSRLALMLLTPSTVYSARVNQTSFNNPLAQITFDGGSGTIGNVKVGMTMYVGSSAGAYDKGIVRIRKAPAGSTFYINETSEIDWANDDYLTIVNEFRLWPRHLRLIGTTAYMDYDVAYSDQHADLDPYPILGPDRVIYLPTDGTVMITPDASESWVLGSTISSYLWTAAGASATADLDTATPSITYNAAGIYYIGCTVTAANLKTMTGYRLVYVYSEAAPPIRNFQLLNCDGDAERGGWDFSIRLLDASSTIPPGCKAILFSEGDYNDDGVVTPVGGYPGCENIIASGWLSEETPEFNWEDGHADLVVHGTYHMLKNMTGFPVGVENSDAAATVWTEMQYLTVDKGLWHFLHWRTTASIMMDVFLPGDTRILPAAEGETGALWEQLNSIAYQTILAKPIGDRYSRLLIQVDSQFLPTASRTTIPVVMDILRGDLKDSVSLERAPLRKYSLVEMSGIIDDTEKPIMSRARGSVFTLHGLAQSIEHLLFDNQNEANVLCGNYFAYVNNDYPAIDLSLAMDNRMVDIAPIQYLTLSIASGDTPRGITWSSQKIIPRRVSIFWDPITQSLTTKLQCEKETSGPAGVTIVIAEPPIIGDFDFELPDFDQWGAWPPITPPIIGGLPEYYPPEPPMDFDPDNECLTDAPANGPFNAGISGLLYGLETYARFGSMPVVIRTASHTNKTTYVLNGLFEKFNSVSGQWEETLDDNFYSVYAHGSDGSIVATGTHDAVTNPKMRTGVINAPAATPIRYISVQVDKELFRPTTLTPRADRHPLSTFISEGTLKWGPWNAGIWASYTGILVKCTWFLGLGMDVGSTIEIAPEPNIDLIMNQNLYSEASAGAYLKTGCRGGHSDLNLSGTKWTETFTTASAYLSDKHEFVAPKALTGYPSCSISSYAPENGIVRLDHFVTVYAVQTYRIHLYSTQIYNVCPLNS